MTESRLMPTHNLDARRLTFSQAQGLEPLPRALELGELPPEVRNRLWDAFCRTTENSGEIPPLSFDPVVCGQWLDVLRDVHVRFLNRPLDTFGAGIDDVCAEFKDFVLHVAEYNKVFDLLQFIMRHPHCPPDFTHAVIEVFEECSVAYVVDTNGPATIFSAATPEEAEAIRNVRQDLVSADQGAASGHLQRAADLMNERQWRESAHESISAVESVGMGIGVEGNTLGRGTEEPEE